MSENKHTPEPWRTDEECGFPQDIHDSKGNLFLRCGSDFDNEIYGEANARRIVACVNALEGLNDYALSGGWSFRGIEAYAKGLDFVCISYPMDFFFFIEYAYIVTRNFGINFFK